MMWGTAMFISSTLTVPCRCDFHILLMWRLKLLLAFVFSNTPALLLFAFVDNLIYFFLSQMTTKNGYHLHAIMVTIL